MAINIINNRDSEKAIDKLDNFEGFRFGEDYFVKLFASSDTTVDAINLTNKCRDTFADNIMVRPVDMDLIIK